MQSAMTQRQHLTLLTLLLLLAFALRALSLDAQSMWRDEIDTYCFSRDFWSALQRAAQAKSTIEPIGGAGGTSPLPTSARIHCQPTPGIERINPADGLPATLRALLTLPGWNGPLYTIAMRPWINLTGTSPFALRFNSLLFGLLAVPLTYVLGRRMLNATSGLVGATLVALSPHLVWYSQEAKMYSVILALALLALYALRRALDGDGGRWWAAMIIATTLALYNHVLAALLIPLQVVLALVWWPRLQRQWRGALTSLACLTLPYLPLLVWQARNWLLPVGRATLFTNRRFDVMLEATFNGWGGAFLTDDRWAEALLAALSALALYGLAWAWLNNQRQREILALLAWILLPLAGIWLISTRQPIFTNRYMVWAAPAFYLLAAAGFAGLVGGDGPRSGRGSTLLAGALLTLALAGDGRALHHQATQAIKPDFRAAAAYLHQRYQPDDLIIFHLSYMQHNFDFYFRRDYAAWGAPAPGATMPQSDLDFSMQTNTSGHETVWLVLSESDMWDPQSRVKAWLDGHTPNVPQVGAFAYVDVYRYELEK